MRELVRMCEAAGFTEVETYIASGNVVFRSQSSEAKVKARLERALHDFAGKPVNVRRASEMKEVLAGNPFPKTAAKWTVAIFLDEAPPRDTLKTLSGRKDEEVRLGAREIYVHYPVGMGVSKLKIAAAKAGTARNMNTIAKLAEMAAEL